MIACSSAAVADLNDGGVDGEASGDGSTLGMDGGKDAPANDSAVGMDAPPGAGTPPFGGSSGGTGGTANVMGAAATAGSINFHLIVPSTYVAGTPTPLLVVYSGTEGGMTMTSNLMSLGPSSGTGGFIRAVLDGVVYNGNAIAGATVMDVLRGVLGERRERHRRAPGECGRARFRSVGTGWAGRGFRRRAVDRDRHDDRRLPLAEPRSVRRRGLDDARRSESVHRGDLLVSGEDPEIARCGTSLYFR